MVVKNKDFYSYAIPWFVFHFTNGLVLFGVASAEIAEIAAYQSEISFIATLFSVIIAGFLSDRIGRKQPMLAGLLFLGISYVLFGIASSQFTFIIYALVEGVAWGFIAVSYMIVVLSDISERFSSKEKYF